MRLRAFLLRGVLIAGLCVVTPTTQALAAGVVGTGTPASCTESALFAALIGGGSITFNCGGAAQINFSSAKSITVSTTLDGGGVITLSGQDTTRFFVVSNGAVLTLRNIVLTNGYSADNGGAIYNGALSSDTPGSVVIENSTIRNSRSGLSGGAIVSTGPLTITNSLLETNQALNGGALYLRFGGARTTIIDSTLRNNQATQPLTSLGGAILAWDGASVAIHGSAIDGNSAAQGGGIYVQANTSLQISQSTLRGNQADIGGGLNNFGTAILTSVTLSGNNAMTSGGGIANEAALSLAASSVLDNQADAYGGGIRNVGTAELWTVTVSGNRAGKDGGGIDHAFGQAFLTDVVLSANASQNRGGGLTNWEGIVMLNRVTVNGNSAASIGGGLFSSGTMTVTSSTLSGNAALHGGALFAQTDTSQLWASNSTIDGNTAIGDGGGLDVFGTTNFYNVTISHNVADANDDGVGSGGGLFVEPGAIVNTRNTLIAVNYRGLSPLLNDCVGLVWSDHSRFTSVPPTCAIVGPSSYAADPNAVGQLADNGGPTLTVALLQGSDAIDAADPVQGCVTFNALLKLDQRGAPRVAGARCDVGAYESGSVLPRLFLPVLMR